MVRKKKKVPKTKDILSRRMQRRLTFVFGLICVLFVVLIGRLMYIEYTEGDRYKKIVLSQLQYDSSTIPYKRGDIIDSKGTVLATSVDVYNVVLDAKVLNENKEDVIADTITAVTKCFPEIEAARSCAGVGSALVSIFTVLAVQALGKAFGGAEATARQVEIIGFKWVALGIAVIFVVFILVTCLTVKERSSVDMKTASVGEMFKALLGNDQAMAVVITIVCINTALYITSNLVLYFFKYDLGGVAWYGNYTLFNTVGGGVQILSMMLLYPFLRNVLKLNNIKIFYVGAAMSIIGYFILLGLATLGVDGVAFFLVPGVLVMATAGINNVIVTVFLANTVDYGELKNGRRDESVIFSMQTFVVKLSSGIAALLASIALSIFKLSNAATTEAEQNMDLSLNVPEASKTGLRMFMTLIPIAVLIFAIFWFKKNYKLTDEKIDEISKELEQKKANA